MGTREDYIFYRTEMQRIEKNSRYGTKQALSPKVNYLQEVTS